MSEIVKFKIGDTVKIKGFAEMAHDHWVNSYGDIEFGGIIFNESMKECCGKIGKIVKKTRGFYRIKFKRHKRINGFYYSDEMLIGVKTDNRYKLKKLIKKINKNRKFDEELL